MNLFKALFPRIDQARLDTLSRHQYCSPEWVVPEHRYEELTYEGLKSESCPASDDPNIHWIWKKLAIIDAIVSPLLYFLVPFCFIRWAEIEFGVR
jgi:hypothetical protein